MTKPLINSARVLRHRGALPAEVVAAEQLLPVSRDGTGHCVLVRALPAPLRDTSCFSMECWRGWNCGCVTTVEACPRSRDSGKQSCLLPPIA